MDEDDSQVNDSVKELSKNDRFYKSLNCDKLMRIVGERSHEIISHYGKYGHMTPKGNRFCIKCGAKKIEKAG